ncbi:hypothetical protein PR048_004622 [Dryococelus australis]|uniref:Uncharacterized protein n=1 Tax=Dryococelus australis TaxID=614101 RepID=A0ABQ9I5X6_9NEOP|nr:hypothetical protein PR048_004622 [Dryococelus australis]
MIKEIDAVSFPTYRRIFMTKLELKFKSLKKDTCKTCNAFAARSSTATGEAKKKALEKLTTNTKMLGWMHAFSSDETPKMLNKINLLNA